jgi:hypothetical protein
MEAVWQHEKALVIAGLFALAEPIVQARSTTTSKGATKRRIRLPVIAIEAAFALER